MRSPFAKVNRNSPTDDCTDHFGHVNVLDETECPTPTSNRQESARTSCAHHAGGQGVLLLGHRFGATTIRKVAEEAQVSQTTTCKVFGGKAVPLISVYDIPFAGDDDDIALVKRPETIAAPEAQSTAFTAGPKPS